MSNSKTQLPAALLALFTVPGHDKFKAPVTIGDSTYATDGCIIIKVPAVGPVTRNPTFSPNGLDWARCTNPEEYAGEWMPLAAGRPSYARPYDLVTFGTVSLTAAKAFTLALLPGPVRLRPNQDDFKQPIPFVFDGGCGFITAATKPME